MRAHGQNLETDVCAGEGTQSKLWHRDVCTDGGTQSKLGHREDCTDGGTQSKLGHREDCTCWGHTVKTWTQRGLHLLGTHSQNLGTERSALRVVCVSRQY